MTLDAEAAEPTITGVLDMDRTWWGDPTADWTIRMALAKQHERVAFWETYEERDRSSCAARRSRTEVRNTYSATASFPGRPADGCRTLLRPGRMTAAARP